jgi:hypothetical protein
MLIIILSPAERGVEPVDSLSLERGMKLEVMQNKSFFLVLFASRKPLPQKPEFCEGFREG